MLNIMYFKDVLANQLLQAHTIFNLQKIVKLW